MIRRYGWPLADAEILSLVRCKMEEMVASSPTRDVLYPDASPACGASARVPLGIASGAKREEIELVLRAKHLTASSV